MSVPVTTAGVGQAIDAFDRFERVHGVPARAAWRCKVALDEVLSNIVRHAGPGADASIEVTFTAQDGDVSIEVVDASPPFNPLLVPPPDATAPLVLRKPGGLGIALVRQLMDEARYEWRGGRNHFSLTVRHDGNR